MQRGRFLSVYRHEFQLNSGLELTLFVAPKARTWSRESVRMIVLEHVGEDRVDGTLSLKIRPIWQKRSPPGTSTCSPMAGVCPWGRVTC